MFPARKTEKVTGFSIQLRETGVAGILFLSLFLVLAVPEHPLAADVDFLAKMRVMRVEKNIDAPNFTLPDLQGEKRNLEEFKGKFIMLNFWSTWWPYCRRERSSLEKVHRDFWARGLIVIAVSTDQGSLGKVRKMVKDYVRDQNLTFLNLVDPDSKVAVQYGVRGIPMTVFINPVGKVAAFAIGYRNWDSKDGRKMLEQILSEG